MSASASPSVIESLRERILSGHLSGGMRLAQRELAAELGVSRIPVRDALRQLAAEGFVYLSGPGSAVVAEMSTADLQELYELREAVEPLACRMAVPNVGQSQLLIMQQCIERMRAAHSTTEWLEAHATFHAQLYEQSGRRRFVDLVHNLREQTARYLRLHVSETSTTEHLGEEHEALVEALDQQDADLVETVLRRHLRTSHRFIAGLLLARQAAPVTGQSTADNAQ